MSVETRLLDIKTSIDKMCHNLKWKDIEFFCKQNDFSIKPSKKGYKVYIKSSVWSVHLEHRTSNELKAGIIRELKKILIKEKVSLN